MASPDQPPLPGMPPPDRVRHCMVVVTPPQPHLPASAGPRSLPGIGGNEPVAAANEVGAASAAQGLAGVEIVLRLEELHQRPLGLAVAEVPGDLHRLLRERIDPRVIHASGDDEWGESLHEFVQRPLVSKFTMHHSQNPLNVYERETLW